jgi:hypothetical protein
MSSSAVRDGGDQCRRGDAEAGNGISGLFFVTGEAFDRTERATTSLSACPRELFPWTAEAERKHADGQGRSAIVSASGSA